MNSDYFGVLKTFWMWLNSSLRDSSVTTKLTLENCRIVEKPRLKPLQSQTNSRELLYYSEIATKTTLKLN